MEQDYLEFLHITKNFPGVTALDDVSMSVHRGEIHALVGENGAGKSTLMNILGGNLQPNGGELRLDGHPVKISSPIDAYRKGIGFVHQESNLLENLSVCENVFLGRERVLSLGRTDRKGMCREIRECCQRLGYQLEPERPVAELNLAERQSVEIVRALLGSPRVLILDEPTAALAEDEVARLFRIVRELRQEGVSVLYISHRLDEIMELADRVTVLKDGKLVGTLERGELDKERMVSMMVGRVIEDIYPDRSQVQFGPGLLRVEGLTLPGKLEHVSFSVRAGEIVGLGGLEGQGQRTAIRAIFGDQRFSQGSISVEDTPLKSGGIAERIRNGVAYVTHDRRGEGLVLTQSIRKNSALAALRRLCTLMGLVKEDEERTQVAEQMDSLQIKASSMEELVSHLSGGNQQKVMLARWLMTKPRVLIIDEPTKGIDIGARMSIYQIIHQLTEAGIGILMLTSDMVELIGLSDRTLVFYEGKIVKELSRGEITEERVMKAASGMTEE